MDGDIDYNMDEDIDIKKEFIKFYNILKKDPNFFRLLKLLKYSFY